MRAIRAKIIGLCILLEAMPLFAAEDTSDEELLSELPSLEEDLSIWDSTVNLRAWTGYKDNVLLSGINRIGSAFVGGGVDYMAYRLPVDDRHFYFFVTAEHSQYLETDAPDNEQFLIAQTEFLKDFADGWQAGGTAEFVYLKQVFDVSTTEADLTTVLAQGSNVKVAPSLARRFSEGYELKLSAAGNRQFFKEPLDDYWEATPTVEFSRDFSKATTASLKYEYNHRFYDTRERRDAGGEPLPGGTLRFRRHEVEVSVRHFWDEARRWRTNTRLTFQANRDNGGGYFDYLRYRFKQDVRYRTDRWLASAGVGFSYYDYDVQRVIDPVSQVPGSTRRRTDVLVTLRGERTLKDFLTVFVEYEFERTFSNDEVDEYRVNTLKGGVDLEF